jgi:hypothetical protein
MTAFQKLFILGTVLAAITIATEDGVFSTHPKHQTLVHSDDPPRLPVVAFPEVSTSEMPPTAITAYGNDAGAGLSTGHCDIFIGDGAAKDLTVANYVFIYKPKTLPGGVLDAYLMVERNINMYSSERDQRCNDLYKTALETIRKDAVKEIETK